MVIQIDSREKPGAIKKIREEFDLQGVKHFVSKLPVGDYISLDNAFFAIDRKKDLLELCGNVTQDHTRFIRELLRASEIGIKLVFLCENGEGITCLEDVKEWKNPRRFQSSKATNGETLYKILHTIQWRHNTRFLFCQKEETGKKIIDLLKNGKTN